MAWQAGDFVVFGALAGTALLGLALAVRRSPDTAYRAGAAIAIAGAFLLVWANGAVGILGAPENDANLMFIGVVAAGLAGAAAARFEPRGMSRVLLATAAAQVLVAMVAMAGSLGAGGPVWPWDLVLATVLFSGLWLLAAWLFARAGRGPAEPGQKQPS